MSFENLNTNCAEHVLTFLSKEKVSVISKVFPEHEETADAYWKKQRVINLDKMTSSDIDALLMNINLCRNIRELKVEKYPNQNPQIALSSIVPRCPALEILDISGIDLTAEEAKILRSCDNLKSLSVHIPADGGQYPLRGLFSNNTQLEHLVVIGGYVDFPENLPDYVSFLEAIIETQSSLKSFQSDSMDEHILGRLFSKNQELKDVTLKNFAITGACLKKLPKGIKRLDVSSCVNVDKGIIMKCLQSRNIEALSVTLENESPNFLNDLVAAAPTLQHISLKCVYHALKALELQELKHLQELNLIFSEFLENHDELRRMIDSCVNLELLHIEGIELNLREDLFGSIAALPKLKEITIISILRPPVRDFNEAMRLLSRSQSLTTARFQFFCPSINEGILTLIRGSNNLTKLEFTGRFITIPLIQEIKELVALQENRTNVLNLTFSDVQFPPEDILQDSSHPLLKVNFSTHI